MSNDEARVTRTALTEAIQAHGPFDPDVKAAVCTSWVYVAEWCDAEGQRWLSINSGNAAGDELPRWTKDGMLNEALNGFWPAPSGDDDD